MTDNEIIKALEQCNKGECEGCPYRDNRLSLWDCENNLNADIVDLFKRQQAEIEELKKGIELDIDNFATEYDNKIKSEAVKEFAEWLFSLFPEDKNFTTISRFAIKQKLNEMVGENNANL